MALTTHDSEKIAATVSTNQPTDVNADIAAPAQKSRTLSREAAILFDKSVVARPLMVPEVCSIRVKNNEYRYRWVNKVGRNGAMYTQRRAQGFINATSDDVEVLGGDAVANEGEITAGDLILMKIRADLYDGAIKANMQKAQALTAARGMWLEGASSDVNSDSTPRRASVAAQPFNRSGKAKVFIPENPDAIVEDSIASGRVDAARQAVEDLRAAQEK